MIRCTTKNKMEVNNLSHNSTNYNDIYFGTLKKVRTKGFFDTKWKINKDIVDEFHKSKPIKEFFDKYNGYAEFNESGSLSPILNFCCLTLKFKNSDRKSKNIFERILSKIKGYSCEINIDAIEWRGFGLNTDKMLLKKIKTLKSKELEDAVKSTNERRYTYIFANKDSFS